ncbi:hypothetical protein, partial [Bartonella sp. AC134YNZD]|uniref:hypothetical protein n=1 Tax=Bartonella sp. AC134YNZD TaxID=3243446 RepID=UPI0035CF8B16
QTSTSSEKSKSERYSSRHRDSRDTPKVTEVTMSDMYQEMQGTLREMQQLVREIRESREREGVSQARAEGKKKRKMG